jgi:Ca-activated chloride channel family protein
MTESLAEAQQAGRDFLARVLKPRDRCFVLGFATAPELLMAPTDDVAACTEGLSGLVALGSTALHDALVTSLYFFRAVRGQRALVLLSDGDDTSSNLGFASALEFARATGVAIYPVGLGVSALSLGVRGKLKQLAEETGGRLFLIGEAEELSAVYAEIEAELRSRYLIAFDGAPPPAGAEAQKRFREVEVKMKERGLSARTMRGYYP